MIAMPSPMEPVQPIADAPEVSPGPGRPLTPAEALVKFFIDNAENDQLIAALRERARANTTTWQPQVHER